MREICMLRSTRRGLETRHGRDGVVRGWMNSGSGWIALEAPNYGIEPRIDRKGLELTLDGLLRLLPGQRARKRKGFGWTRWSRQWLYAACGAEPSFPPT